MIFIVVKFETKPDWTKRWPGLVDPFTTATRAEPGNLWFNWSRSVENPSVYVWSRRFGMPRPAPRMSTASTSSRR